MFNLELGGRLRAMVARPISYEELSASIKEADEDLANGRTTSLSDIHRDMNTIVPSGGSVIDKKAEAAEYDLTFEEVQSERPDFEAFIVAEAVAKALNLPTSHWERGSRQLMSVQVGDDWRDYPLN